MRALDQTAGVLGIRGDQPNIALAERLAAAEDKAGVKEIIGGLRMDTKTAGDCIKVLYEIGYRKPTLIAPYADVFLGLLASKNNRLVWGAMTALAQVAALKPDLVYERLDTVLAAYQNGSVITRDSAVSVLAALSAADGAHAARIMPLLIEHFKTCRAKEIPQHFQRVSVCLSADNHKPVTDVIRGRLQELTPPQQKRVLKVLKKLGT